ncbi:MAG: hypothetical protein Q7T97_04525 [Burkholderiaceae bacterium]|nr:hypothetical protein [Burkholderiaceae bacterium]
MNPSGRSVCRGARWLAISLLAVGHHLVWANDASEKARINNAKAEADAVLAAKEAECRQRFVVNACLIEARQQHRAVVQPLREELILLDEKQRKQRAADRTGRIRAKAESSSGVASDVVAPAAPIVSAPVAAASRPAPRPLIRPRLRSFGPPSESPLGDMPAALPEAPPSTSAGAREGTTADAVHTHKRLTPMPNPNALKESNDRVREIEERRESVLKRNAEKAAKKPPAAPLPVPGAASSAAR